MFTNVNTTTVDPVLHFVLLNSPTTTAQHFGTFRTTDCHLLLRLMTTEPHFTLLRSTSHKNVLKSNNPFWVFDECLKFKLKIWQFFVIFVTQLWMGKVIRESRSLKVKFVPLWSEVAGPVWPDASIIFQYMSLSIYEKLFRAYKICQTRFKILPNIKYTLKKLPKTFKILPKWRQIWPNPVTLDAAFVCSFNERPERIVIDLAAKEWKNKTFWQLN